jgi:hypothetical protein
MRSLRLLPASQSVTLQGCWVLACPLADSAASHFVAVQLADEHYGVIGLKWKEVGCDK